MRRSPEAAIARFRRRNRRQPQTVACMLPPFRELVLSIDGQETVSQMSPVDALPTKDCGRDRDRSGAPLAAGVVMTSPRPMGDFTRITARGGRPAPAGSTLLVHATPESTTVASRLRPELAHWSSPFLAISCLGNSAGGRSMRSRSVEDHPPPSASIRATKACTLRVFSLTSES